MKFFLSDEAYKKNIKIMDSLTLEQKSIARKAGTGNPLFEAAWKKLHTLLQQNRFKDFNIEDRFDIRALSVALTGDMKLRHGIDISSALLIKVSKIIPHGSNLFIESLLQFFLSDFNLIKDPNAVGAWLSQERQRKGLNKGLEVKIFCSDGPTFFAQQAIKRNINFEAQVHSWGLDAYASGDFIKQAKSIYFVEQLQKIPVNEPHKLLEEVSKQVIAEGRYDADDLVGHVALRILIDRAPSKNVHDSWRDAVIAIAGDPRVPRSHARYIKWWSQLTSQQIKKVQGWLSKLDLKLFLEALEDYSISSRDDAMMRMFPSRKHFLEGLHESGAIVHTKLYLSKKALFYVKRHYKAEHIPEYSIVEDGDISVIYAELSNGHMVEGSHNCQIWFYKKLHESAPVLQFDKQKKTYRSLTLGLNEQMYRYGCEASDHFSHSPANFSWQRRALEALNKMGLKIRASDVLSGTDYNQYKRLYGVS
ncbi:conserved hypothetical protein [Shewanella sp. ANA-3]|uniref:EH signature domain-containing protein n=1 Tax=Shewanella sp. (strain ANA-3) TaxID=94122 RepID=UPI00005DE3EA|nr:EH signature domain-containing protein [Shewanella sp. ANA-3]ABK50005.1 conserved hypothetical protein [Shewanella sp. ANA-3]